MAGEAVVQAAIALVGVPFRLHGRCPESGVDCVGLAWLSMRGGGVRLPDPPAYKLRAGAMPMLAGWMRDAAMAPAHDRWPGDLLVVQAGTFQPHLLIDVGGQCAVHAHAGVGRVVLTPVPVEWPILSRWRPRAGA